MKKGKETQEDISSESRIASSSLQDVNLNKLQRPIVFSKNYDIAFAGLERLHPFDAGKWGRVKNFLIDDRTIDVDMIVEPKMADNNDLLIVHTQRYLNSLNWSARVAIIIEVPFIAFLPNFLLQRFLLRNFKLHVGGTVLATKLALEHQWAINIGGGFHHCSGDRGGGFCIYADITLALKFMLEQNLIEKAMIVDLDAHQGNGHERDFASDDRVFILDMYNASIYPNDHQAKKSIRCKVELRSGCTDDQYLPILREKLEESLNIFEPDLVFYNAGTDCLNGDALGQMAISKQGIIERDQIVFEQCRQRSIPIVMVTSGGYQRNNARVIADSLRNLKQNRLILYDDISEM